MKNQKPKGENPPRLICRACRSRNIGTEEYTGRNEENIIESRCLNCGNLVYFNLKPEGVK